MEEKSVVTLNSQQILELKEIILDKDRESAYKFLKENIYQQVAKPKESGCKPPFW